MPPITHHDSIDWTEACRDVPFEDFLQDYPLPERLEEAVEAFCRYLEQGTFETWEAVIRSEQGLPLGRAERERLRSLVSFGDNDDRVLYVDDAPRPGAPWYRTLHTLAEALCLKVVEIQKPPLPVYLEGWAELSWALEEHGQDLRLPPGATSPPEVIPPETRAWLEIQVSLCALCSEDEDEEQIGLLLGDLTLCLSSVRDLDLTVASLLERVRMPTREAFRLERGLLEALGLSSPHQAIADALEAWESGGLRRELESDISRERAREIVELGSQVVPALLEVLEDPAAASGELRSAAMLLGAIGDASALPLLLALLTDESTYEADYGQVGDAVGQALASLGIPAGEALLDRLENGMGESATHGAMESLCLLGARHPELRPRAATAFMRILKACRTSPFTRALAVSLLMDLDWREALPECERCYNRGEIDPEFITSDHLEEWRLGEVRPCPLPEALWWFKPSHRRVLAHHRSQRVRESGLALRDREEELERDRARLRESGPSARVGRNDPCPCGSGRKYKKCHLELGGSSVRRRAAGASWSNFGYELLPSEQIDRLGEAAVQAHLDLLEMPLSELPQAAFSLTDDYLNWAVATRLDFPDSDSFLARVAVSEQRHPALDYASILALALDRTGRVELPLLEKVLLLALRSGDLAGAWHVAGFMASLDPDWSHAMFDLIRRAAPNDPWTALAMADVACGASCAEVVEALEQALSLVQSGAAHPPCPAQVVQAFLEDHRQLVQEGRLRRRKEWCYDSPLRTECQRELVFLGRDRIDLERRLRNDLEDLEAGCAVPGAVAARRASHARALEALDQRCLALAGEILEGKWSLWCDSRAIALGVQGDRQLLWFVAEPGLSTALAAAEELSSGVEMRPWGRWYQLCIDVEEAAGEPWTRAIQAARQAGLALVRVDALALCRATEMPARQGIPPV